MPSWIPPNEVGSPPGSLLTPSLYCCISTRAALRSQLSRHWQPCTQLMVTYPAPCVLMTAMLLLRRDDLRPCRFRVFVCTAAPCPEYASMAWRHLDPQGMLIPEAMLRTRIVANCSQKSMSQVLPIGLGPRQLTPDHFPRSHAPGVLVVDDRQDVSCWPFPS